MLCKYNKYPTTKVSNKVIVHTYLPAQIPLADFKWRMAIFIVILANHSYGFNHHLVHFRPLFSAPSIGKMVLKNSPVLEPFKKSLLTTANSCQEIFAFLSVFISLQNYPTWFTGISTISNNSFSLFNLEIKGISIICSFRTSFSPPQKFDLSCVAASKGPLNDTTFPCQILRQASYFFLIKKNYW